MELTEMDFTAVVFGLKMATMPKITSNGDKKGWYVWL